MAEPARDNEKPYPQMFGSAPAGTRSVADYLAILWRRRRLLSVVLALSVVLGALAAWILPHRFTISTLIEIGQVGPPQSPRTLETVESVTAKLSSSYIPLLQQEFMTDHATDRIPRVDVRVPRKSELVLLVSRGTEGEAAALLQLQRAIAATLIEDHGRLMHSHRAELEVALEKAKITLAYLEDPSTLEVEKRALETGLTDAETSLRYVQSDSILAAERKSLENKVELARTRLAELINEGELTQSKLALLDEKKKLLEKEIAELESLLTRVATERREAAARVDNENSAMTLLLLDNEEQQSRARLTRLQEELLVNLPSEKLELTVALRENQAFQEIQHRVIDKAGADLQKLQAETGFEQNRKAVRVPEAKAKIANLEALSARQIAAQAQDVKALEEELEGLRQTRLVTPPMRSLTPLAPSKVQLLISVVLLGLIVASGAILLLDR